MAQREPGGRFWEREALSGPLAVLFVLILVFFSAVMVAVAVATYRMSLEGSLNFLRSRAVGIAVNLELALERSGLRRDFFPDLVRSEGAEDLAFLALYDRGGRVVLHSNPNLIGRRVVDPGLVTAFEHQQPVTHQERLGTGEEVFVLDFPLRLQGRAAGPPPPPGGAPLYCLRVVLHPAPARAIVRRATVQVAVIGLSLVVLWVLGSFFLWAWRRNLRLQGRLREQERLAALGRMAAVLAHEIRNPLSTIKGFAQYHMEAGAEGGLRDDLGLIVAEARRLERLTTNLLTYARPARPQPAACDIETCCRELRRGFEGAGDGERLQVECGAGRVVVDREMLQQVVWNLTRNALEAVEGMEDGRVWVRFRRREGELEVEVEDSGPGLAPEVKERLFEPFVTTKARGSGLGLAIVRRLTEAMGGEIRVEDRPGGGARFRVRIPAAGPGEDDEEVGPAFLV